MKYHSTDQRQASAARHRPDSGNSSARIFASAATVRVSMDDLLAKLPFKPIDVTRAARIILRGVARNKAIIVFPLYGRLVWWLRRLCWAFGNPLDAKTVRDFRKSREEIQTETR